MKRWSKRVAGSVGTIFGVSLISFVLLRVLPGDPVRLIMGYLATEEAVAIQRQAMGLDDNLLIQYARFVTSFVQGDWGFAFGAGADVGTLFAQRFPASLELGLFVFIVAFGSAVGFALLATYRRWRWVDRLVRAISYIGLGTPPFWLALLALAAFSQGLNWMPGPEGRLSPGMTPPPAITRFYSVDALLAGNVTIFFDAVRHLALPVLALAFAPFAFLVRLLRANLLEIAREPFMLTLYGKGSGRWYAFSRHALPNAFLPTLTVGGIILAEMLAGSVLVEKVFNWPGMGALVIDSISRQDFAVVQAFILLSAVAYVLVNLAVDMLYEIIDPRIRAGATAEL